MGTCEKCGREIKDFGVLFGGVRCPNDCSSGRDIPKTIKPRKPQMKGPKLPAVLITREELIRLPYHGIAQPTGTEIGKRWRKPDGKGGWLIGECFHSSFTNCIDVKWSQAQLPDDLHDESKHLDNLETLVMRLARYIEKSTDGDSKLADQAIEYMQRQARGAQSFMRTIPPTKETQ